MSRTRLNGVRIRAPLAARARVARVVAPCIHRHGDTHVRGTHDDDLERVRGDAT